MSLSADDLQMIDTRLASIKFPDHSHNKKMLQFSTKKQLKARDYENLLFYGWVAFDGIVEDTKLLNFKQLAYILSTLSGRVISKSIDIRHAEVELANFISTFRQAYNQKESFMYKINFHYIMHLCEMVRNYGPLPIQSAYFTENVMGLVSKRVKTGSNVSQQVIKKMVTYQSIVSSCSSNLEHCSQRFLNTLSSYLPKLFSILPNCKMFASQFIPSDTESALLSSSEQFKEYQRITLNSQSICTKRYNTTKATSTINHCIRTIKGRFYIVQRIVELTNGEILLLVNELLNPKKVCLRSNVQFSYVFTFLKISTLSKLPLSEFSELVTYTTVNHINYIFILFNKHL